MLQFQALCAKSSALNSKRSAFGGTSAIQSGLAVAASAIRFVMEFCAAFGLGSPERLVWSMTKPQAASAMAGRKTSRRWSDAPPVETTVVSIWPQAGVQAYKHHLFVWQVL